MNRRGPGIDFSPVSCELFGIYSNHHPIAPHTLAHAMYPLTDSRVATGTITTAAPLHNTKSESQIELGTDVMTTLSQYVSGVVTCFKFQVQVSNNDQVLV